MNITAEVAEVQRQARQLSQAGKLLKIELLDHVIMWSGTNQNTSLIEQGYMA